MKRIITDRVYIQRTGITMGIFPAVTVLSVLMTLFSVFSADAASFSEYWKQDSSGSWYVEMPGGERVRNAWLCDDAVSENGREVWYLIDGNGNMVTSPLIRDGSGNCYSTETEHNGRYGMLRNRSGRYGEIFLNIEEEHNGNFGAIKNADGVEALSRLLGADNTIEITASECVYTSDFLKSSPEKVIYAYTDDKTEQNELFGITDDTAARKVKAREVDEGLCAEYFIEFLNDYRSQLGLDTLDYDEDMAEYARERAARESISHAGNTAKYEICCTHGILPSEYAETSVEEAAARNALEVFKSSASHNSILKQKKITKAGAGFRAVSDRSTGAFNFYFCEANFE